MMVQFDVKRVQKGTESFMVSFDFTKTPVTQIADYIIIAASKHSSSDIHFDPREDGMMVRFRIDGDCQDYTFVPKAYEKNLTTRLKLLANMNITESRLPQDGAIKGDFGGQYLDMRVSSLPLNEGEKIVIRILDYSRSLQGIESLGFHSKNLEKVKRMMEIPNGIILTTGATGSGKSTTTYSILQGLNKPETNIITVEDPIEMNIEGINQVQVNSEIGMTFAAALRSILRQDPNIILIGEIRDSETAQIAVRASITGHLVLSTIHTNNALATVERLLDMDVERYLLSTALSGIISQRLAKMLCPKCRYQREVTQYEKKVFKKFLNKDIQKIWEANPKGCESCRHGYHGRIAFHEVLEIDETISEALSNEKLDKKDLSKMVYSGNTITMLQDALIKCLDGKTSFEEVYRNIEIENEDDENYENEINSTVKESVTEEEAETEDNLLETPVNKSPESSSVVIPQVFTAADFDDSKEKIAENNINTNQEQSNNLPQQVINKSNSTILQLPTFSNGNVSQQSISTSVPSSSQGTISTLKLPDTSAKTVDTNINPITVDVAANQNTIPKLDQSVPQNVTSAPITTANQIVSSNLTTGVQMPIQPQQSTYAQQLPVVTQQSQIPANSISQAIPVNNQVPIATPQSQIPVVATGYNTVPPMQQMMPATNTGALQVQQAPIQTVQNLIPPKK